MKRGVVGDRCCFLRCARLYVRGGRVTLHNAFRVFLWEGVDQNCCRQRTPYPSLLWLRTRSMVPTDCQLVIFATLWSPSPYLPSRRE